MANLSSGWKRSVTNNTGIDLQPAYKPEFEDWLFHVSAAVCGIRNSGYIGIRRSLPWARGAIWRCFCGAAAALIGIHNAWDAVTYHVFVNRQEQQKMERL